MGYLVGFVIVCMLIIVILIVITLQNFLNLIDLKERARQIENMLDYYFPLSPSPSPEDKEEE